MFTSTGITNKKIRNYITHPSHSSLSITGVSSLSNEPIKPRKRDTTSNDSFMEAYQQLRDFQIPIKKTQIPRYKYQFDLTLWMKEQIKDFLSTGKFKLHSLSYETEMIETVPPQPNLNITPQIEIA